jgi:hypothetical protein
MDLINKNHPHAANYHLRQVLEHTSKLLEQVEDQRVKGAAAQSIQPFKKAQKFDEALTTALKESFRVTEKPWGATIQLTPNHKIIGERLKQLLADFRQEVEMTKAATAVVAAHNKQVGDGVSALLETIGIPRKYSVNVPKRGKIFNYVDHAAGYANDISRVANDLQQDGTYLALNIAQGLEKQLEVYMTEQHKLQKEADVRAATLALRLITPAIKDKYGFSVSGYEAKQIVDSLLMGIEFVTTNDRELDDYELNKQIVKLVESLYVLGAIQYDPFSNVLESLPVGVAHA